MAQRSEDVYQLKKKLEIAAQTLVEADVISGNASLNSLAVFCEISYPTLKSAWEVGRLSQQMQKKISEFCDFDLTHHAWIDRNLDEFERRSSQEIRNQSDIYAGRDTPAEFRRLLRKNWGLSSNQNYLLSSSRPEKHPSLPTYFAIDDAGQETSIDSKLPIFLQLDIEPIYHESGYTYGFQKVVVRLIFSDQNLSKVVERLAEATRLPFGQDNTTIYARGTKFDPAWVIEKEEGFVAGNYVTNEAPLCKLTGFKNGDHFEASAAVQLRDGSLRRHDGLPLPSENKSAIIQQLISTSLDEEASESGWLNLSKQHLDICKASQL